MKLQLKKMNLKKKSFSMPGIEARKRKEKQQMLESRKYLREYQEKGYKISIELKEPTEKDLDSIFLLPESESCFTDDDFKFIPVTKKMKAINQLEKDGLIHGFAKIRRNKKKFSLRKDLYICFNN
jgi:hypothetical protein